MLRTQGTLLVKRLGSRNGPFCVADLLTDFGEFKVKDPLLDQFQEGEYRGTVWITEIYLAQYVSFGRGVTELRARLHDVQIDTEGQLPPEAEHEPTEPDPIEEVRPVRANSKRAPEEKAKHPRLTIPKKGTPKPPSDSQPTDASHQGLAPIAADRELFGDEIFEMVQARRPVKLDPTIGDRAMFRKQTRRLGELDYDFDAKQQTWFSK